jgi:tryptophanyl-tRNA synthetase
MGKKRVYSGIRATGRLHLGNYLGAVKGMFALQDTYDCVFSVVDLHALTTPYDPKTLQQSIRDIVLDYLAAGLDPDKCLIEIQSQLPHAELSFLLSTIYPVARLEDLPTYKDKKAQHPKYVNMGLLYYPVLMAADILLYKGELVPVGVDQEPHLEVAREIARKFNSMFGETFPQPKRFATPGEYVPSLTGAGKMGKSVEGSYISLGDDLTMVKKKIAKVPTDSGTGVIKDETYSSQGSVSGGVKTLMVLMELFGGKARRTEYEKLYTTTGVKYSEMKEELSEAIYKELEGLQEKRKYFEGHPEVVDAILEKSRERCLTIANETMREVKEKMGLL